MRTTLGSALLAGLLALAPLRAHATTHAQEPNSRQKAGLAEDQALLLRQLARLRQTMEVLAQRYEAEGRTHAAKLLREGLKHLEQRATDANGKTLEELMKAAREDLSGERTGQSIETQAEIVKSLERLYAILTDRADVRDLERSIENIEAIKKELAELAKRENDLRKETAALREQAATKEQKDLAAGLQKALEKERKLLERTQEQSRASGQHELAELERKLDELIQREATDRAVLEAWKANETELLRQAAPSLERAAAEARRAQRLSEAAQELRKAAREVRDPASDLAAESKALESAAEREERDQRTTQDPTAAKTAGALRQGAEDVKQSPSDAAGRAATARKLEERVDELARAAEEQRAAAQRSGSEAEAKLQTLADEKSAAGRVAQDVRQALESQGASETPPNAGQEHPARDPNASGARKPSSPEEAARKTAETQRAVESARRELERGVQQLDTLKQALAASQAEAAEEARRIERDLDTLPQGATPPGQETQKALEEAAEAQQAASEAAARSETQSASQAARQAEAALRKAREALARARQDAARQSAASPENQALQKEQAELEQETKALAETAREAGLEQEAETRTENALESARQAMQRASAELQQGQSSQASQSEQQAVESLQEAQQSAQQGGELKRPEDRERAKELAKKQAEIQKQLLELAERNKKREGARPSPSMEQAAESASAAQQSLDSGDMDQAEEEEAEAERQMKQAERELQEEEEQYQKLRAEELLFKIADEVKGLLAEHQKQMTATVEVDGARKGEARPTHSQRLRLRKIAQSEATLAARAIEIGKAIAAEESLVFAEILDQVQRDLGRIAHDMDEAGDWQSGERVQGLQEDVERNLKWLAEALDNEKQRRRQEQQQQQDQQGQNRPAEERLVPDAAELKMLRRLELETLQSIQGLRTLHPEIESGGSIDPLVLEDLARLAYKHQRTAELFQKFRKRLGLPDPEQEDQ